VSGEARVLGAWAAALLDFRLRCVVDEPSALGPTSCAVVLKRSDSRATTFRPWSCIPDSYCCTLASGSATSTLL
jgi:hypothetical protein